MCGRVAWCGARPEPAARLRVSRPYSGKAWRKASANARGPLTVSVSVVRVATAAGAMPLLRCTSQVIGTGAPVSSVA